MFQIREFKAQRIVINACILLDARISMPIDQLMEWHCLFFMIF